MAAAIIVLFLGERWPGLRSVSTSGLRDIGLWEVALKGIKSWHYGLNFGLFMSLAFSSLARSISLS